MVFPGVNSRGNCCPNMNTPKIELIYYTSKNAADDLINTENDNKIK